MDHVEVRQRLADALSAGTLPTLLAGDPPADGAGYDDAAALGAHMASCAPCRAEAGALVTTGALLAAATPDDVEAPVAARERILRSVRDMGMVRRAPAAVADGSAVRGPVVRRWHLAAGLVAVALSVVIAGGLVMVASLGGQRDTAQAEVAALADLATASSHILARPDHAQLSLATADGTPGGMLIFSPSSGQVAVWSRALSGAVTGTHYDCFVARGGSLTLIGWMDQAGDVAYWIGQVPVGITLGQAGDRIVVQAEQPGASPALSGTF